jgi:hypothetical protein
MPLDRDLVPEDYLSLHEQALRLLELPELGSAVQRLLGDDAWGKELADQPAIGEHLGFDVPEGLDVRVVGFGKPGPDWVPFTLRLTGCRHYWVRERDGQLSRVEVCRGFEIVPNPVPGGPWG